jgi:hypothetical protein
MKKIVASVGIAAIGASAIHTASAQVVGDTSKLWSISATLRGFYDDNTATIPNNQPVAPGWHRDSFGFEIAPSGTFVWSPDAATSVSVGMLYSYKYYENPVPYNTGHGDNTFTFSGDLKHAFNERMQTRVSDSFVIGQEPDLLRAGNTYATFQRVSGDNIRNQGAISFDDQFTPKFGMSVGYENAYYDYADDGFSTTSSGQVVASTGGMLNRDENRAHLEGLYTIQPETKGILGYQFSQINYLGDQYINGNVNVPSSLTKSDSRDTREQTLYAGAEHNFNPELTGALRAGASYTDYINNPPGASSLWTPYVNATLSYIYAQQSTASLGFSYDRSPADVTGNSLSTTTLDAEAFTVFASISHRITPQLFANLIGQFQNSLYHGGTYNDKNEQYYLAGLDLEYRFNQYLSAHVGYNYDNLQSQLGRAYDRNRAYIGVTGTY